MSSQRPKEWISAVLSRLDKFLELSVTQDPCLSVHLENLKECLVNISQSKCPTVINGLANSLKKLSSIRIYGEQQEYNLYTCQMTVLGLLEKCISKDSALPDDKVLTKQLLPEVCQFLHQPSNDKPVLGTLQASASRVLYKISQINFNVVFNRISTRLKELSSNSDESADHVDLDLIQHIHLDLNRIKLVLEDIVQQFSSLRRSAQQTLISSLDKALWRWFCSCTTEFNSLYRNWEENKSGTAQQRNDPATQQYTGLSNAAERLFEILDGLTDGSKKKAACYWPLQTLLIAFCPDTMASIANHGESGTRNNKAEFMMQLRKSLQSSGSRSVHDSSLEALVRLLKAATFVTSMNRPAAGPSSSCPLHRVVDTYLSDLQNHLFDNASRQVIRTCEQAILIECLVSSFRFRPEQDSLIRKCSSSSSSLHHKLALIQSLHCICNQPCLEWWPKICKLYPLGSYVRKIFMECVVKGNASAQSPRSTQQSLREKMEKMNASLKRNQDEVQINYKDILQLTVRLITADPTIFLQSLSTLGPKKNSALNDFISGLTSLCTLKVSAGPINLQISCDAFDALLHLHDPSMSARWFPESLYFVFWDTSTSIIDKICACFVVTDNDQLSVEVVRHALNWMQRIIAYRFEFVSQNQEPNMAQAVHKKAEIIKRTWRKLETTLMDLLYNTDSETVLAALGCFQNLFEEAEIRWSFNEFALGRNFPDVLELYRSLGALTALKGHDSMLEQVCCVFRRTYKFSEATFQAWENTRAKWEMKTAALVGSKQMKEDNSVVAVTSLGECNVITKTNKKVIFTQQDFEEWERMSMFLCSLGGACINYVKPALPTLINWTRKLSTSSSNATSGAVPPEVSEPVAEAINIDKSSQSFLNVSNFVKSLLLHLYSNSCKPNDFSNKIGVLLGRNIHPTLYPTFFEQLTSFLTNNLFNSDDITIMNGNNDRFVQNIIIILQNIFLNAPERDGIYFGEESVESMLIHIVRYVRHMELCETSVRTRFLLCKMIYQMMLRKNDFFFLSEIKFRNKLVEHLTDWMMTSPSSENNVPSIKPAIMKVLDESVVEAVGILLHHLPLQPDEGDGGDVPQAKSQLFNKYFTLFMKLLPDRTQAEASDLRRYSIVAMCNLLRANIESGMAHAMSLAYRRDVQTRAALLEVLTKILQQGRAGCFDTLGDSVAAERFQRLVELVTMLGDNGELPIANALANVVHTNYLDELARVFVILFDAKHLLYHLLWNMFSKEVEDACSVQTIFRGSSLASKIITFCFKVYGASYLHNLVEPLVAWSLTPEVSTLNFEVDERRSPPGYNIQDSRDNLQQLTDRFFNRIMRSTDKFPPQLKSVCHCLYQVVSQRFPDSGTGALAGAIFLRFLNPAIATPYANGLCDKELPPELLRAYRLMCKIMQNIANHVLFTKEEHMKYFNEFVTTRFDACQQFFVQISTSECTGSDLVVHKPVYVDDTNITALHRLLWNEQEKIGQFLSKSRDAKAVGKKPYDKMVSLLAYLGPPEYTRPVLASRFMVPNLTRCNFEDVMAKRKVQDSEEFKMVKGLNIFYQFGRSKMGYPVFYYVARRFESSKIHEDILAYYILLALKPYSSRKFDLVVDLTHVTSKNSFRSQYIVKWPQFFPSSIYNNLDAIYIYNPSSWSRDFVEYNASSFDYIKGKRSIYFVERLECLQKFIFAEHQKIPSATRSLDEDVVIYSSAIQQSDHARVHIKVSPKALQLTYAEKRKFLSFDVTINDVYYPYDIEAVRCYEDGNSFCIKVAQLTKPIIFAHPESGKIVKSLSHMRCRWELAQPNKDVSIHDKVKAKDVPGALINISLLNLGCSSPLVRSSAYNLLCALSTSFQLQLEGSLCESEGLCIPSNNVLFIVGISNTLAKKETHLTLEFLMECIAGFRCCVDKQKSLCLEYMEPWLFNLPSFLNASAAEREKVKSVIGKLIELTVDEGDFYPSVQTKIWGNFGKMPTLIDLILETFISASIQNGINKEKAEAMADASVALAANNMQLVSSQIIKRLCMIVDKTSLRPTPTLDKHKHWDEIAILARCLLMLSFNNNLDVAFHLPDLFHLVSLLLSTGSTSLRASIHGLVVNIVHSLLTCRQLKFNKTTRDVLRTSLDRFCLPKFYCFFGIPNVQSAAYTAFQQDRLHRSRNSKDYKSFQQSSAGGSSSRQVTDSKSFEAGETFIVQEDIEAVNLRYLDLVADSFLEIMEACIKDSPNCRNWLNQWREVCERFAFQYNPSLQPRALVVLGCISKNISLRHVKKILTIMGRSLECRPDPILYEATLLALTRMQSVLDAEPAIFCIFFWLGICAMQLNDKNMYIAGLSLLEGSIRRLNDMNAFYDQSPQIVLMKVRSHAERFFQQLELVLDVSFNSHFHFAVCTYLIKGFRLNDASISARVVYLLEFMLELVARCNNTTKFNVNSDSLPYLAVLLPVSEEVERHCVPRKKTNSSSSLSSNRSTASRKSNGHHPRNVRNSLPTPVCTTDADASTRIPSSKSLPDSIPEEESFKGTTPSVAGLAKELPRRSSSRKSARRGSSSRKMSETSHDSDSSASSSSRANSISSATHFTTAAGGGSSGVGGGGKSSSVANGSECNALLDEEVLDAKLQALLLTLLATQVKYSRNFSDVKVLYEYLAEASIIFPNVFPIVHGLLDHKINNVLQHCDDPTVSSHVQVIVHNALLSTSTDNNDTDRQLTYLQGFKFSGMWKFAGPFAKSSSLELANCVTKIIDLYLNHSFLADVDELTPASTAHNNPQSTTAAGNNTESDDHSELSDLEDSSDAAILDAGSKEEDRVPILPPPPAPTTAIEEKSFRNRGPKLTIQVPPTT